LAASVTAILLITTALILLATTRPLPTASGFCRRLADRQTDDRQQKTERQDFANHFSMPLQSVSKHGPTGQKASADNPPSVTS
jgi:hypothetical protein